MNRKHNMHITIVLFSNGGKSTIMKGDEGLSRKKQLKNWLAPYIFGMQKIDGITTMKAQPIHPGESIAKYNSS